jgi:hypothetical protein
MDELDLLLADDLVETVEDKGETGDDLELAVSGFRGAKDDREAADAMRLILELISR